MPLYRVALNGLIDSGKDFVAEQSGLRKLSMARALYPLCKAFFGVSDYKSNEQLRKFMQTVGQWGWGYYHPEKCPYTVERATFCGLMRTKGRMLSDMPEYEWQKYGLSKTFWVDGMMHWIRWNVRHQEQVCITNVRFQHEYDAVLQENFSFFLVLCADATRYARHGAPIPSDIDYDTSEEFARSMSQNLPDSQIIWNDTLPMPEGKKYLTVEEFCNLIKK